MSCSKFYINKNADIHDYYLRTQFILVPLTENECSTTQINYGTEK